jgi:hypothetical protein
MKEAFQRGPPQITEVPFSGRETSEDNGGEVMLASILWAVVVILVVLWLIGLIAHIGGGLIYILLVIAAIVLIYNLIAGRSRAL